tara:strand:- start:39 stop:689 length:651 start_codon:yes stop_codon:yes gene_type:complete
MAVAPLNKFLTVAVPVAPGITTVYATPTGVSAIVLFATVANVGIGTTYPKVSFTHRRKSTATQTFGNTRNIRVIKDGEIPPNDSLVVIDGRLVLERTALISDSIVVSGVQSGIVSITNAEYDHVSGIVTITTEENHGFNVDDEVTMSNLNFTVGSGSVNFPDPQRSFIVTEIPSNTQFVTNAGIAANSHTYSDNGLAKVAPLQMELVVSILENSTS